MTLYSKYDRDPARVGVKAQPIRIVMMVFLLIARTPFTRPTPTTAPTTAEEVDTGMPNKEKRCMPKAEEI